jgi:hypothetical protein
MLAMDRQSISECDEAPGKPRRRLTGHINKNVQIAFDRVFAPSHGTKDADIPGNAHSTILYLPA